MYFTDTSVTRNIAYGIPEEAIDRTARIAHIHDFVSGELPEGYNTLIGERGGGSRAASAKGLTSPRRFTTTTPGPDSG